MLSLFGFVGRGAGGRASFQPREPAEGQRRSGEEVGAVIRGLDFVVRPRGLCA